MSYEKDVKITFYNMEDGEEVSDEYSEFLMINRDGEVFELVHSYEGDWVGYKMESRAKADEYEEKAKAWDKYKTHMESHIAGEINEEELVSDLKSDYFESGDYDA